MKILLLSDVHLRTRTPVSRKDDFFQTQMDKLRFVCKTYHEKGCKLFLQAGDLFDSPDPSRYLLSEYIQLLKDQKIMIHTILGQHDVTMHSLKTVKRSATRVLEAAGVVFIVDSGILPFGPAGNIIIQEASWGKEIPQIWAEELKDLCRILVCHYPVGDKPLFPGHELTSPRQFLRQHPGYDLVLAGDYHYRFHSKWNGSQILNTGCMVRLTKRQEDLDHQPQLAIYDTETKEVEWIGIPHEPSEDVFDLSTPLTEHDRGGLTEFVNKLRESGNIGTDFMQNLREFLDDHNASDEVRDFIAQGVEEVGLE